MKIAYCSDLHLEFGHIDFEYPDADILLLAGDICIINDLRESFCGTLAGQSYREFFHAVSKRYKVVIYTPGNHDYWFSRIDEVTGKFYRFCQEESINNIIFNPFGIYYCYGVKFVYATMWTDVNKGNPVTTPVHRDMNDYRNISFNESRMIRLDDILDIHQRDRDMISRGILDHSEVVVMTHHAPNLLSVQSTNISAIDYMYGCTDMDDIILDNPQIKLWIHGHVHEQNDYMIGQTRILSNCRGYSGYDPRTNDFEIKVLEL